MQRKFSRPLKSILTRRFPPEIKAPINPVYGEPIKKIYLGETYHGPTQPLFVPYSSFLRHALIVGSTGSGKTTTASRIATELSKYSKVIVVDWNGEYLGLLNSGIHYRVSSSNPVPIVGDDVEEVVNVFEEVLSLTPPQAFILEKALGNRVPESLTEVLDRIEESVEDSRWFLESKLSLLRKLSTISKPKYAKVFERRGVSRFLKLLVSSEGPMIADVSSLSDSTARKLASLFVLKLAEYLKLRRLVKNDLHLVVDEVHNLIGMNEGFLSRLHAEVRKLGIGLVIITQSPSIISKGILTNTNIKVVHTLKSREDIELISRSLGLYQYDVANLIARLEVGEALIDYTGLTKPALVRIEPPT